MMTFVGAAVDYTRAGGVRTAMQAALDATALMLSKGAQNLDGAAVSTKANEYFNGIFNEPLARDVSVTLKNAEKEPGDVKVSIVPFAVDVDVGTDKVDASWIDWTQWDRERTAAAAAPAMAPIPSA